MEVWPNGLERMQNRKWMRVNYVVDLEVPVMTLESFGEKLVIIYWHSF